MSEESLEQTEQPEVEEVAQEENTAEEIVQNLSQEELKQLKEELDRKEKDLSKGFSIIGNREAELKKELEALEANKGKLSKLEQYEKLTPLLQRLFSDDPALFREGIQYLADESGHSVDDLIAAYQNEVSDDPNVQHINQVNQTVSALQKKIDLLEKQNQDRENELKAQQDKVYIENYQMEFGKINNEVNPDGDKALEDMAIRILNVNFENGSYKEYESTEIEMREAFKKADEILYESYQKRGAKVAVKKEAKEKEVKRNRTLASKPGGATSGKRAKTLDEASAGFKDGLNKLNQSDTE